MNEFMQVCGEAGEIDAQFLPGDIACFGMRRMRRRMVKKIAAFIGQLTQEYQSEMIRAVIDTAKELGYRIDIFSEFGSYGENYLHAEGERNIINLPYIEDYAGILIAPDTFGVKEMEKQLDVLLLRNAKVPIVSLRQEKECYYSVQVDNQASMESMVEHFVAEHGMRRVCFMKGRVDLKDAEERYQAYLNVMARHGLPVTEHMVFQGDYWRDKGPAAVDWFLSGSERPEAIVCANDFMAISVLGELKARGVKVPEEIAVSGFDDLEESKYVEPALSSVHVPSLAMGREAVLLIDKLLSGGTSEQVVRLPVEIAFRRSCGCGESEAGRWTEKLYREKLYLTNVLVQNGFMNADFDNCDNLEELLNISCQYSLNFPYAALYFCLCDVMDENGERLQDQTKYTEYVTLRAIMSREKGLELMDERFPRRQILPEKYRPRDKALYFFPLHHKNHCLGYLAIDTDRQEELKDFFQCWTRETCSYMDKILLYEENQSLQEFRKLSTVDDLTGLFNRRKMEQELSKTLAPLKVRDVKFFVVSLDMDGLKAINDTYGHLEGDCALRDYAGILKKAAGEDGLCCRMGGDEFSILVPTEKEEVVKALLDRIREGVAEYNRTSDKPYQMSGSMGYAEFRKEEELTSCLRRADINMYADKMARKKERKN